MPGIPTTMAPIVDMASQAATNKGNFINNTLGTIYNAKIAAAQYNRQRADSLADWNRQNEYNSPKAQMQRLKEAGLNPHLVYGNGATATSSTQPRQSDLKSVSATAANATAPTGFMGIYDAQIKEAQTNNLQQQLEIMKQEVSLKAAQTAATLLGIEDKKFNLGLKGDLRETTIAAAKAALDKTNADIAKTKVDTQFTFDENQRQALMNEKNLRIATIKATQMLLENKRITASTDQINAAIKNMGLDARIKAAQAALWEKGINPNWPAYQQILLSIAEAIAKKFLPGETKTDRKGRIKELTAPEELETLMLK